MSKYGLNIIWSEEDQAYIATCPEFPGLSAFGESIEDAIAEAKVAQELFAETYEQEGLPLPEAQLLQGYSGQFRLRLPQTLHFQLAKIAERERVSLNQLIVATLATRVGAEQVRVRFEKIIEDVLHGWMTQYSVPNTAPSRYWSRSFLDFGEACYVPIRETESNQPRRIISNISNVFEFSR